MRIMSAPASANARAIAWPIPRVPPVTTAVLPASENISAKEDMATEPILSLVQGNVIVLSEKVDQISAKIRIYEADEPFDLLWKLSPACLPISTEFRKN